MGTKSLLILKVSLALQETVDFKQVHWLSHLGKSDEALHFGTNMRVASFLLVPSIDHLGGVPLMHMHL